MIKILVEVDSLEYNAVLKAAARAGYEFAKEKYEKEKEAEKMYSKEEAMKKLGCKRTKLFRLIKDGEIKEAHGQISGKSIANYFERELKGL